MSQRGQTLGEAMCVIALVGMFAAIAIPAFLGVNRRKAVQAVADELRGVFRSVRAQAIARSRNFAVRFTRDGAEWQYAVYEDGDGDGVRSDDIRKNIDRMAAAPVPLARYQRIVRIALPPAAIVDPDGDEIEPDDEPVQFNRSAMCSFSPVGAATPGSVYLTDGVDGVWCLRVYGATARVRVMRYDAKRRKWEAQ